jgi:hypothetical protein
MTSAVATIIHAVSPVSIFGAAVAAAAGTGAGAGWAGALWSAGVDCTFSSANNIPADSKKHDINKILKNFFISSFLPFSNSLLY